MHIGDCCNHRVHVSYCDTGIEEAARLMRQHRVSALVVLASREGPPQPVGLITDQDLVHEVLALGRSPAQLTVEDIMSSDLLTGNTGDGLWETLERMLSLGLQHVPVVDHHNNLHGLLSLDDVQQALIEAECRLMRPLRRARPGAGPGDFAVESAEMLAAGGASVPPAPPATRVTYFAAASPVAEWLRDTRVRDATPPPSAYQPDARYKSR